MAIKFGFPKREKKEEMFPYTPIVTMKKWEGKGHGKKFEFNTRALELLEATPGISQINYAIDDSMNEVYMAKNDGETSITMAKNASISYKRLYDFIIENYGLSEDEDNHLILTTSVDLGGTKAYKLELLREDPVEGESNNPVVDKEIEHMTEENLKENISAGYSPNYRPHGDEF